VRDLQGVLDARFSGEQASREPNEREHVLFADLIEPAPRVAEQFPSAQLLLPCRIVDRLDGRVETFAEVRKLRRERHWTFADEGQSAPIRGKTPFLSLVHESLSRKVTIDLALALAAGVPCAPRASRGRGHR